MARPLTGLAAAGAALAGAAVVNQLSARRSEARHPPAGRFVTVDGVRLHYLDEGSGPVVVLLHGAAVGAADMAVSGLVGALARSRRVVAFDRPGYGYSRRPRGRVWTARAQARLLLEALEQIGVEEALVVGHSWGALVAAAMGVEAPGRVSAVVLMSGYYRPTPRPDAAVFSAPAIPGLGDLFRLTLAPWLGWALAPWILRQVFAPAPVTERFKREFPMSLVMRPSQLRATAADAGLILAEAAKLRRRLPGLSVPTLILAGRGDRVIDYAHQAEWLSDRLDASTLLPVEGAGHMVHHCATDVVAAAIERFGAAVGSEPTTGPAPRASL